LYRNSYTRGMNKVITKEQAAHQLQANLKKLVGEKAIGVRELARQSQNDPMIISRIINHATMPAPDALLRIAEVLEVSVDYLFKNHSRKKT
jgi:transcriptional regulator with XRE-family HTH domain